MAGIARDEGCMILDLLSQFIGLRIDPAPREPEPDGS